MSHSTQREFDSNESAKEKAEGSAQSIEISSTSAMDLSLARFDVTQIFCDVDDVYRELEQFCERDRTRLPCDEPPKGYQSRLSISEVMTIVIAFHGSGYRTHVSETFKHR